MIKEGDSGRILNRVQLVSRLKDPNQENRIFVLPRVDDDDQVGQGSLDVRLGTDFIITKRTRYSVIDPLENLKEFQTRIVDYQERIYTDVGSKLILHPNQIVLGCTLEYIRLPPDIAAYVIGRSSWGRLGLVTATATFVHPFYAGIVTLEMVNLGDTPIALYPGIRIAQLVFHEVLRQTPSDKLPRSTYSLSTRPSFSKIHLDKEWRVIEKLSRELEDSASVQ